MSYRAITDQVYISTLTDEKVDGIPDYQKSTKVWEIKTEVPSTVSIDNKDVYDPVLRKSASIKKQFVIRRPRCFGRLFTNFKIGVGSKHIYVTGDFMKKHRDVRLPDMDGLAHTMTLVVLTRLDYYHGGRLKINNEEVPLHFDSYDEHLLILFPINAVHEVTEVTSGERQSFVFPVYGECNPFKINAMLLANYDDTTDTKDTDDDTTDTKDTDDTNSTIDDTTDTKDTDETNSIDVTTDAEDTYRCTTIYDSILDYIEFYSKSTDSSNEPELYVSDSLEYFNRARLLGMLELLNNRTILQTFVKYQMLMGDHIPYDRTFGVPDDFVSTYENENPNEYLQRIVEYLHKKKKELIDMVEEQNKANSDVAAINIDLPTHEFAYVAANMYYKDTKKDKLIGVDAKIQELAKQQKREVVMYIGKVGSICHPKSFMRTYHISNDNSRLVEFDDPSCVHSSPFIRDIHTEFNDSSAFEAEYEELHCILLISPKPADPSSSDT